MGENKTVENKGLFSWSYPQSSLSGRSWADAILVLWPANSGSGWGFQHPSCQGWGAKAGGAGSSLSVRHRVSQPRLSTADSLIPKHRQAESTKDCAAEEVGNTLTVSVGAEGAKVSVSIDCRGGLTAHCCQETSLLLPSPVLYHLWVAVWLKHGKKQMTKNTFSFFGVFFCWLIEPVHCTARGPLDGDANDGLLIFQEEIVGTWHLLRLCRVEDSLK